MVEKFHNKNLSPSSKLWLARQQRDIFSRQAKVQNYRSRAAYKLIQMLERDRLIKPAQIIADLGAAPGGWAQIASNIVGEQGHIFALDLLPITGINNVTILEGDFLDPKVSALLNQKIISFLAHRQSLMPQKTEINQPLLNPEEIKIDGVLSDLSPNISGIRASDNAKALELWQNALRFSINKLRGQDYKGGYNHPKYGGFFVCKLFHSEEANEFTKQCKQHFRTVNIRKPEASRNDSRECFLVALDFIK